MSRALNSRRQGVSCLVVSLLTGVVAVGAMWAPRASADWGKYFVQTAPIDLTGCTNLGMFGVARGATLSGIALNTVDITATGDNVGALVGTMHASRVQNMSVVGIQPCQG